MTQNERVLNHLRERGSITPIEALHVHGVYRLAARVNDLKRRGYDVVSKLKRDINGHKYAEYRLGGE